MAEVNLTIGDKVAYDVAVMTFVIEGTRYASGEFTAHNIDSMPDTVLAKMVRDLYRIAKYGDYDERTSS